MLIENNKIQTNDVVAFKIVGGEEIIARVTSISDTEFIITKPLAMTLVPQGNSASVAFVPWTLGMPEDAKITLNKSQILAFARARKEAADGYIRNTSSIQPAGTIPGLGA